MAIWQLSEPVVSNSIKLSVALSATKYILVFCNMVYGDDVRCLCGRLAELVVGW